MSSLIAHCHLLLTLSSCALWGLWDFSTVGTLLFLEFWVRVRDLDSPPHLTSPGCPLFHRRSSADSLLAAAHLMTSLPATPEDFGLGVRGIRAASVTRVTSRSARSLLPCYNAAVLPHFSRCASHYLGEISAPLFPPGCCSA